MAAGLSPAEFWEQTPRTYVAILDGAARRQDREIKAMLSQAWHTEAFARTKKLPKLSDILSDKTVKPQTNEEKLAMFRAFAERGAAMNFKQIN